MIGDYDIGVDGEPWGLTSLKSYVFGQDYHFNRSGGRDSRIDNFSKHIFKAKEICAKKSRLFPFPYTDKIKAVENLGIALHPLQDWVAHGDYGKNQFYISIIHNSQSPQTDFGNPSDYPDNIALDAVGSSDGRPAGNAMHNAYLKTSIRYVGATAVLVKEWVKAEFAYYQPGNKRFQKTRQMTTAELKSFKSYLKSSAADRRCRCFFLNDGE